MEPPIKDSPRKGQPPNKGRTSGPLSHSFNLREEDNLSTEDKMDGPYYSEVPLYSYNSTVNQLTSGVIYVTTHLLIYYLAGLMGGLPILYEWR